MDERIVHYNNNIFSYQGRLSRLAYIIQNSLLMLIAFRFIYYPYLAGALQTLQHYPMTPEMLDILNSSPEYASFIENLKAEANPPLLYVLIRYLLLIPLRIIDIKRVRDIVDRNLTNNECALIAVIFSLPFVDFFSTLFLVFIPANKYAKSKDDKEIKKTDLQGALKEQQLLQNKQMFEEGKISRAEFETNRAKINNS